MGKKNNGSGSKKGGSPTGKSHPLGKYYNDQKEPIKRGTSDVKWWG